MPKWIFYQPTGGQFPLLQRKTQSPQYWKEFAVQPDDIEHLFKMLLESDHPQSTQSLVQSLIHHRLEREEVAIRTDLEGGTLYQPQGSYAIGERLVFPRFDYAVGTVAGQRGGYSPRYGEFAVVQVDFGARDGLREFAAEFTHPHQLNLSEGQGLADMEGGASGTEIFDQFKESITPKLHAALKANPDFVHFRDSWLLKGLIAPVHGVHLNIAEAAIDIHNQPLPADVLLKDLDLPAALPAAIQEFSLNHTLDTDERFVNVGPRGQVLWYLRHMEPPALHQVPRHLQLPNLTFDARRFHDDLRPLLYEIDDEATDPALIPAPASATDEMTIVLSYPHRESGTLPITARTESYFPRADNHHVRIALVDRQTGQRIPGWVVSEHNYVVGLGEWYAKNQLVAGAYVTLHRTDSPLTVGVSYRPVRPKREWVRGAVVHGGRLSFQNLRLMITCQYDDLMIVGEDDRAAVDALWEGPRDKKPLLNLLRQVALELIKINPQGTVHAKTLYSAINVVRRCPPGPIFQELSTNACFVPMGHGYWMYDATKA